MPKLGKYDEENVRWEGGKILTPTSPPKLIGDTQFFGKGYLGPYSSAKFHPLTPRVGAREIFKYFRNL